MKRIFTIVFLLTMAATIAVAQKRGIHVFAHRGCWSRNAAKEFVIPENSVAAVAEARRRGYEGIELDVRKTTDGHLFSKTKEFALNLQRQGAA